MTTVLLGPQRFRITAGTVVRSLAPEGPVATVTAGWEDREGDDGELDEVMGGDSTNLRLYARLTDVMSRDPTFAEAAIVHRDAVDELVAIYSLRLQRSLESVYAVQRRTVRPDISDAAVADGIRALQAIDAWYLQAVDQLYGELEAAAPVERSDVVMTHRGEVAELLGGSVAVAIAGGHVAMLLRCLRLFDAVPRPDQPVVAWSAGAMALTDRVLLYNDNGPQGSHGAELWDRGLGRVHGVIAMPHARRRLKLDDAGMADVFVRRFWDATCLPLDDGARVDIGPDGAVPPGTRVLSAEGTVVPLGGPA